MCILMTHEDQAHVLRDAFYFKEKSTNSEQNAFLPHNVLPDDMVLCFFLKGPHCPSTRPDHQDPDLAGI